MGGFDDADLRRPAEAKGVPVPVGEVTLTRASSATLLQRGEKGGWEYGDEVDASVTLSDMTMAPIPDAEGDLFWSGITVRIDAAAMPKLSEGGYYLVAAVDPPSHLLFVQARLLPTLHTVKAAQRAEWLRRLAAGAIRIDEIPFDPFEDHAGWMVARLGDPFRPHWQAQATEELGNGIFVDRSPHRTTKKRRWFFALCPENPGAVVQKLIQQMEGFKEDVVGGAIAVPPRKRTGKAKSAAALGVDWQEREELGQARIYQPKDEEMELLLDAAVRQALAGRERDSHVSLAARVRTVFKDHLRDMEQRLWIQDLGRAMTRKQLEASYKAFRGAHPDCDCFRPNGRLQVDMLNGTHADPVVERCRRLWIAFLRA